VKLRLLFTSALFLFVQIATMHAQERVDVAWLAPPGDPHPHYKLESRGATTGWCMAAPIT
jgi:hypothetical protein